LVAVDLGDDADLCIANDQLLLEPLSELQTITDDDAKIFREIVETLIERLFEECHYGRADYCQQLRARLEIVAQADKFAKEDVEAAIIASTLRMRGSPGMSHEPQMLTMILRPTAST